MSATRAPAGLLLLLPLLLTVLGARPAAATAVAIEEIQLRSMAATPELRQMLGEFLSARVAALPGLRVIPRPEVRAALEELKREAAARCGEGSCPMELGRELAASKVLAPEIVGSAHACVVTLSFFDVKTATVEAASLARGGCDDAALAHSLSRALEDLAGRLRRAGRTGAPAPVARPGPRLVSIYFSSCPLAAELVLDGEGQGETPLRLDLVAGRTYRVQLKPRFPYGPYETTIVAKDWLQVRARLTLEAIDRWERATTPEWFSLGVGSGLFLEGKDPLFAFLVRFATLKWRRFFWTAVDASVGITPKDARQTLLSVGSRGAFPIHLGSSGTHQLLLGCGLHYSSYERSVPSQPDISRSLFSLSPGLEYTFVASNGTAFIGAEARAVLPVAGELAGIGRPYQLIFALRFGLSLSPVFRRARREAAGQSGSATRGARE